MRATSRQPDRTRLPSRATPQQSGLGASPFATTLETVLSGVDAAAPQLRGRIVHEYMAANGYFENPALAEELYSRSQDVDQYLDQISLQASVGSYEDVGVSSILGPSEVLSMAGGFAAGLLVTMLYVAAK